MSIAPESTGVPSKTRRTTKSFWTLLILAFAIGGMALSAPGLLSNDVARAPAHSGLAPSLLLWNPLTITDYSASPSPGFLGNVTTISVTATGGLPFNVSGVLGYGYSYAGLPPGCTSANSSSILCTPTPTAVGNYTVVVTVTDAGGNVTKNAIALEIDAMTITSFQESVTTVALGGSTFLWSTYAGAVGAITWTWAGLPTGLPDQQRQLDALHAHPGRDLPGQPDGDGLDGGVEHRLDHLCGDAGGRLGVHGHSEHDLHGPDDDVEGDDHGDDERGELLVLGAAY